MPAADARRIYFPGRRQVAFETVTQSQPEPDQLLVRCRYSLISAGTELAMYTRSHIGFDDPHNTYATYPFYPGYAAMGTVEEVGAHVRGFAVGDTVFYPGRHGSHSSVAPATGLVAVVPPDLGPAVTPFARFGQIAHTAVHVASVQPDATVAVIGLGLIGNLAAQLFQLEQAAVIGVDPLRFRREMARESGIDRLVDPTERLAEAAVRELTGGEGADIVVEATGDPSLVPTALEAARPGGEIVLLGSPRGLATIDIYRLVHRKGVTIKGAHETLIQLPGASGVEETRASVLDRMLGLLRRGGLRVEHLVSRVVRPEQAGDAYEALLEEKDSTIGILIDWSENG